MKRPGSRYGLTTALTLVSACLALAGCGAANGPGSAGADNIGSGPTTQTTALIQTGGTIPAYLKKRARPIGAGARFHPPITGAPTGICGDRFGARAHAHIEIFGANKVVLLAAGIGTATPRTVQDGRVTRARCFGSVVTLDPTGIVYMRPGAKVTLGTLFRAWGQPLSNRRIGSFKGASVRLFVNGKRSPVTPDKLRITPDAEIVIEVGPYVPPHASFAYPANPKVS